MMTHAYRWIVLVGLLVGLVVNTVAIYTLKSEVAMLRESNMLFQQEMSAEIKNIQLGSNTFQESAQDQLAEHERLIMELERMINYQIAQ